ncbi:ribonuclease D [[Pasteurella] aerogenes]|nr:ribonuclease D [[Pasteurella] aerogenes]MDY2795629.1 ribonuclease D [[Pasteurella] aerogenes]VEG70747.1 ribonuclease D [[Pasteurella] aerogenes]
MTNKKELENPPHFVVISSNQDLYEVCLQAERKSAVALDTEFVRTRTYYAQLGLIQLYDGEQVSLIDPNHIDDFSPFIRLLANPKVVKVLHASSEDLEVFQHYFQQLPTPMLDTQIIAAFLGLGNSVGLASLLKHYFGLEMDKGASRTDWLARPLSDTQLYYAAADVWYLLPLYVRMQQALSQTAWQSAVEYDCENLLHKREQGKDSEMAYLNIPNAWKLNSEELMRLKLLAKWRQEEAIKRNLALNFVVKGENLWQVAKYNPKHTSALLEIGLSTQEVRIHGKKMLQVLEQMKRIDMADYPPVINRIADDPRYKRAIKLLQQHVKDVVPPTLAPEVLAGKKSLESLLRWIWLKQQDPNQLPELLCGWRREYGLKLLKSLQSFA